MAIRCNNCGAPLSVESNDQAYAVCSYCQTATALPQRRREAPAPAQPAPSPVRHVPPRVRTPPGSIVGKVAIAVFLAVAALAAIPAWVAFRANRPLPKALPVEASLANAGATKVAQTSRGSESQRSPEPASSASIARPEATTTARKAARATATGTTPAPPSPSPAPVPSPTVPPPAPKPTATSTSTAPEPPPRPRTLHVSIGSATIEAGGPYPKDKLSSGLSSARSAVTSCYSAILTEKPDTAGTLNMGLQIAPEGTTRGVGVTGSFLPSNLISCLNRAFGAVRFQPPADGKSVNIRYVVKLSADP